MNTKAITAFISAQKQFSPALKTSTNPHFRSKYADLSACIDSVIDGLHSNGLALMQTTHPSENGITVETVFLHESGEILNGGILFIPSTKHDAQGFGSALTYARRYSLMAACGLAPEDDDGNDASRNEPKRDAAKLVEAVNTLDGLQKLWITLSPSEKLEASKAKDAKKLALIEK